MSISAFLREELYLVPWIRRLLEAWHSSSTLTADIKIVDDERNTAFNDVDVHYKIRVD